MSTTEPEKVPAIPAELWMLLHNNGMGWVVANDDPPDGENYLVCLSAADALAAADHQASTYDIDCRPVRVK